jgi:putative sporulation protein YyaC
LCNNHIDSGKNKRTKFKNWRFFMTANTGIATRQQYINISNGLAFASLSTELYAILTNALKQNFKSIVFICIGTDRSTGDSLGPLIGYKIGNLKYQNVYIHGSLDRPVHAKNLDDVIEKIYRSYNTPFVIAIDACLGSSDYIGFLSIGEGSIKPGAGVNKNLREVGDAYITGIVNIKGLMDFMILQNTRLSIVMKMADIISMGIKYTLNKIFNEKMLQT